MDSKGLTGWKVTDEERGRVSAVFATFNVVDKDGDVTLPGAFEDGARTPISSYGHGSSMGDKLPVGVGTIRQTAKQAILDGQFFMDTTHGVDTFRTVKALHEAGQGEWSYAYTPQEYSFGEWDGKDVRILAKQQVHEVSPVLVGAGEGTRTLTAKGASVTLPLVGQGATSTTVPSGQQVEPSWKCAIRPHSTELTDRAWDPAGVVAAAKDGDVAGLRSLFAWSEGDPELKSSYRYPHHHGAGGPANIRALVIGIANLNGAKGAPALDEADRLAVYEHLAGHLRDAELEPPELRAPGTGTKQIDKVAALLAECSDLVGQLREVGSSRALRGKSPLSSLTLKALGWHREELAALDAALAEMLRTPNDDLANEYARYVAASVALTL